MARIAEADMIRQRYSVCAVFPALGLLAGLELVAGCSPTYYFVRQEPVGNSSMADPREPTMRAELARGSGYYLGQVPSTTADGMSPPVTYGIIDVGYKLPLVTLSYGSRLNDTIPDLPYDRHTRAIQVATPVVFHLIWDPFSPSRSSPIVDTDYEFGGWLAYRAGMSDTFTTRPRWEFRSGVYLGHISTHVGDEYVTHAQADPNLPFPRINVSHEPWRLNFGFRRTAPRRTKEQQFFDFEQIYLQLEGPSFHNWSGNEIWYQLAPAELDGLTPSQLAPTGYGLDGFIAVDWRHYMGKMRTQTEHGDRARPEHLNAAVQIGWMKVFAYDPVTFGNRERYAPTLNVVFGYTFDESMVHSLAAEPYVRYSIGPNPYGQLRNDDRFSLIAFGVRWSL
jgi:hypothetical protein